MRPFRFVHIADVHLDTPFLSRSESARRRLRSAAQEAFERAVELTLQSEAHALLIAGDLFDHTRIAFQTERFLTEQAARLQQRGIRVFYACGNHDPGGWQSAVHRIEWPDNVTVFSEPNPRSCLLRDHAGQPIAFVTGAGHARAAEGDNLAVRFPAPSAPEAPPGSLPHVGLLHAWVYDAGGNDHDKYAPCHLDDLVATAESAHIDYWALGHIHLRQTLASHPPVIYPGNPQGRSFRETGPKGGLLVDIHHDRSIEMRFVPLAPIRWETLVLDNLSDARTVSELQRLLEQACRRVQDEDTHTREWLLRLQLKGPSPLASALRDADNRAHLEQHIRDNLGLLHVELQTEGLTSPLHLAEYREGPHVLATALELLERAKDDDDLLTRVAPPTLAGLATTEPSERLAYLRELLADLPEIAATHLVAAQNNRSSEALARLDAFDQTPASTTPSPPFDGRGR